MINTSTFPRRLLGRAAPLALLLLASASLHAEQPLSILLNGTAEVPPVLTPASATGKFIVLPDRSISGNIRFSGMAPTMAHIHEAPVGKNGPPIITLSKTPDDSYSVPAGTRLSEAQYTSHATGKVYVNVRSARHPDGEIRAQLPGKPMLLAN
ncbi:MAG: CHRD domain-containing protein [Methylococcus sp.]|nr:MAG: CHRD domain-containing protein [Methylococcus sp.]